MTARGAAPADGPRQHLRRREGRRRPGQLLPRRQPRRPPGAGPAVGGRPGRRGARGLPASATASPSRGRPGSGSSWPSPAPRAASTSSAGRPASPSGPTGELLGVHVRPTTGSRPRWSGRHAGRPRLLESHRQLLAELGGRVPRGRRGRRRRRPRRLRPGRERDPDRPRGQPPHPVQRAHPGLGHQQGAPASGPIDVHVISTGDDPSGGPASRRRRRSRLCRPSARRRAAGWLIAAVGLPPHARSRQPAGPAVDLPTVLLLYLVLVLAVGAVGGSLPALVAAVAAVAAGQLVLHPALLPVHHRRGREPAALVVFLVAAGLVSVFADLAARRRAETTGPTPRPRPWPRWPAPSPRRTRCPSWSPTCGPPSAPSCVAVLRRDGRRLGGGGGSGRSGTVEPDDADVVRQTSATTDARRLRAGTCGPEDRRAVTALGAQLATAVEARRLQGEAAEAQTLAEANDLRAALAAGGLPRPAHAARVDQGVDHQPAPDATSPGRRRPPRTSRRPSTRRPTGSIALVENLLDMSRLEASRSRTSACGRRRSTRSSPAALASLGGRARDVSSTWPRTSRPSWPTPPCSSGSWPTSSTTPSSGRHRVNRCGWRPVLWQAGRHARRRPWPGHPAGRARATCSNPSSASTTTAPGSAWGWPSPGASLEAMGGELALEDTPGGGTTAVVSLPQAGAPPNKTGDTKAATA